jgi:hypothetical protein
MNERIKELAKQATKIERHYTGISGYDVSEFDKEKFAELIVKECADVVYETDHFRGKYILEHFGVE